MDHRQNQRVDTPAKLLLLCFVLIMIIIIIIIQLFLELSEIQRISVNEKAKPAGRKLKLELFARVGLARKLVALIASAN